MRFSVQQQLHSPRPLSVWSIEWVADKASNSDTMTGRSLIFPSSMAEAISELLVLKEGAKNEKSLVVRET